MNELIEKVENLKQAINNTKEVEEYNKLKKEILKEKELLSKIEEYNLTKKESLKEEIGGTPIFQEYKRKETNINLLIMYINHKLKELETSKECKWKLLVVSTKEEK